MGFKFKTREEYKRVKKMDRQDLENYIDEQKKLSIQARGVVNNLLAQQLQEARKEGWDLCAKHYAEVLDEQVDELMDTIDEGVKAAILHTKGIGVKRANELLGNLIIARDQIKTEIHTSTEAKKPQWCEDTIKEESNE